MRYPEGHKQKTKERILESAERVFREHGYAGGGVGAVMEGAGMTKGGFYAHFRSKESLLAAALARALKSRYQELGEGLDEDSPDWVAELVGKYLSLEHLDKPLAGCPVPALLSELHRAGREPREAFEQYGRRLSGEIAARLKDEDADVRQDKALAILATLVGGMSLARTVNDRAFSERILAACREFLVASIAHEREFERSSV